MFWSRKKPSKDKKLSREEMIAQIKRDAVKARENIGEETLAKVREAIMSQQPALQEPPPPKVKKEPSPADRARELIRTMDKRDVADYVRSLRDEG